MNLRKQRFVDGILEHGVATRAAEDAGYSKKCAHAQGCRLLKDADVRAALAQRTSEAGMRADEVLRELAAVGRLDVTSVVDDDGSLKPFKDWPVHVRRAVASIEVEQLKTQGTADDGDFTQTSGRIVKVRFNDKVAALQLLGRNHRLFTDKLVVESESLADLVLAADRKLRGEREAET